MLTFRPNCNRVLTNLQKQNMDKALCAISQIRNIGDNDVYPDVLRAIGTQVTRDVGTISSPKKRNPPPFVLRQWPRTFLVTPCCLSCERRLTDPLPSPSKPSVTACTAPFFPTCWSYPQLCKQKQPYQQTDPATLSRNILLKCYTQRSGWDECWRTCSRAARSCHW